jgi:hypothetical protein
MFEWLRGRGNPPATPLRGAPPVRRQKTHSAESGYVYQYYYLGYRETRDRGRAATEYVFDVSADRKTSFPVSILVAEEDTVAWETASRRKLSGTERYAIAKMALFRAFDERDTPARMRESVWVDAGAVASSLETLGID